MASQASGGGGARGFVATIVSFFFVLVIIFALVTYFGGIGEAFTGIANIAKEVGTAVGQWFRENMPS